MMTDPNPELTVMPNPDDNWKRHKGSKYYVHNSTKKSLYETSLHRCNCKDFQFKGGECKHMKKVFYYEYLIGQLPPF